MYNNEENNNYQNSYSYSEYQKPQKKGSSGTGKKIILSIIMGAFFGLSASLCFYLGNQLTGSQTTAAGVQSGAALQDQTTERTEEQSGAEKMVVSESGIENTQTVTAIVTDVTQVVDEVMPSVVSITNTALVTGQFWGREYQTEQPSSGSGIIVGENENELLIVTNYHVIEDSLDLKVQFIDESVATAKVKGSASSMDLAVLAVNISDLEASTLESISIATLGDSNSLKVGEPAIAIGNALGYGQSVTTGVISALDRQIEMAEDGTTSGTLIQTDAAINPGNSGGALLNMKGEVIGINSNKIGGSAIEGMGYAIPISNAKPIIEDLMSRETKDKVEQEKKGYLGISGLDVTSDVSAMYGMPEGVFVTQVYEGGAKSAGMLKGDIIVGFEGSKIRTMEDLQGYLEYYEMGETVEVTVQRGNAGGYEEITLQIMLGAQSTIQQNP
ncbi:MAG: trypsin-like peptidase domain-containing protein [Lachnospiraceae bacterium]|nr:trypsin-like peptidase domain-containing protein [Lachnospiraceae bacterium]MDY3222584.1 trypsin-like peptidase domain-containing protein [Lachnospiraceae bacterium]